MWNRASGQLRNIGAHGKAIVRIQFSNKEMESQNQVTCQTADRLGSDLNMVWAQVSWQL